MSTNAPTSRRIMYMHCHVNGVSLEVIIFFSNKYFNRKFPIFFQKKKFLSYFFFELHFLFLLVLHFESSSSSFSFLLYIFCHLPICPPYIHFFLYIKGIIVEKFDLNFFRELFWSLSVLQPNLRNLTWIHCEKSSPLQTCKCFFFKYIYEWQVTLFFKEEKDLLFSNMCWPSSFA